MQIPLPKMQSTGIHKALTKMIVVMLVPWTTEGLNVGAFDT